MSSVADAIVLHGPRVAASLSFAQQKVLSLIVRCRTGSLGGVLHQCSGCGRRHWTPRSCGNRHCPACGHQRTQAWVDAQRSRLLPVHHFLVTFTVPRELGFVLRDNPRTGYACLFDASSQSLHDLAGATRTLKGCRLGFFGVLHTWGRDPQTFHPHIHYVVPGGGVRVDQQGRTLRWQSTPENFLVHHRTLLRIYKAKLADSLRAEGLYEHVPADVWSKSFVVDIRAVGDGTATLKYLAPYVHRVAISDRRIVSVDKTNVTYTVRPSKSNRIKRKTLSGDRFVRSFAQHILPAGFQKIRHYGWMSPNSKISLDEVRWLVWLYLGWTFWLASGHAPKERSLTATLRCAQCGSEMKNIAVTHQPMFIAASNRSLSYFDSG